MITVMRPPWRQSSPRESLSAATVLLASTGKPFSDTAIARAALLARGDTVSPEDTPDPDGPETPRNGGLRAPHTPPSRVRVIVVATMHGSSFGLQHPGLMPNGKERDAAAAIVTAAIKALQKAGAGADGEVVITRSPGRSFARAARAARDVKYVVVDEARGGRLGRLAAGAAALSVRYRLKEVDVTAVSGGVVHDAYGGHR